MVDYKPGYDVKAVKTYAFADKASAAAASLRVGRIERNIELQREQRGIKKVCGGLRYNGFIIIFGWESCVSNIYKQNTPVVWTIGHSDSCGGTGVQADLHTFHDFEVYGWSVITSIVAQNSFSRGYALATERKSVVAQINALNSDMSVKVIKVAVIPELPVLEPVAKYIEDFDGYVIYDLELENSGDLLEVSAKALEAELLPQVDLFIVNTEEVLAMTGIQINDGYSNRWPANDGSCRRRIIGAGRAVGVNHRGSVR